MKTNLCIGLLAVILIAGGIYGDPPELSGTKAELMGRVEHFFMNNFRDVTFRKSLEWVEVETDSVGNRSIRYMYKARIWDKETLVMNQIFTFDLDGKFVRFKNVDGFPKKEQKVADVTIQKGMIELVEDFFRHNFKDITSRETLEWGKLVKHENGNSSIRYKFAATIWGKDKLIMNQIFTFDSKGNYVSHKNVEGFPKKR